MSSVDPRTGDDRVGRLAFLDSVKGLLICLVVLYHTISRGVLQSDFVDHGALTDLLKIGIDVLRPMRMPVFFFVSGMLAVGVVARPWSEVARRRIWLYGYLFLLWSPAVLLLQLLSFGAPGDRPLYADFLLRMTVIPGTIWFLYALMLYVPLAKIANRLPVAGLAVGAAAFLLSAEGWGGRDFGELPSVAANFLWFFLGLTLSNRSRHWYQTAGWGAAVLGMGLFLVPQAFDFVSGQRHVVSLGLASLGALMFVPLLMSRFAAAFPGVAQALGSVGTRTLPIYVLHLVVLYPVWLLLDRSGVHFSGAPATLGFTAVSVGLGAALPLAVHRLTSGRARFLFVAPGSSGRERAVAGVA